MTEPHEHEWIVYWRCEHATDGIGEVWLRRYRRTLEHTVLQRCSRGRWIAGCAYCGEPGFPIAA